MNIFHWQRCFTRKRLARKTATIKRFEFLLLSKELKAETDVAKKTIAIIKQYF